jgi:hypothetical protein
VRPQKAAVLAWGLWLMQMTAIILYCWLLFLNRHVDAPEMFSFRGSGLVAGPPIATCAALVMWRRPANPMGWLLAVASVAVTTWLISGEYGIYTLLNEPGALPRGDVAAWLHDWVWVLAFAMVTPGLMLFPDGTPLSSRWRPLVALSILGLAALAVAGSTEPGPLQTIPSVNNPFGLEGGLVAAAGISYPLMFFLLLPASAVAVIVRFRRAGAEQRAQLKWLAIAGVGVVLMWGPGLLLQDAENPTLSKAGEIAAELALVGVPAAITVAIMRYRLYDVDLLIHGTLVYGGLTVATVASYAALVVAFGWTIRTAAGQGSSEVAVAATTLVVAALFQPARHRIQSIVDRRFYRSRYDAALILESFQQRLRDQTELEPLRGELAAVVRNTVQPVNVSVWLQER